MIEFGYNRLSEICTSGSKQSPLNGFQVSFNQLLSFQVDAIIWL